MMLMNSGTLRKPLLALAISLCYTGVAQAENPANAKEEKVLTALTHNGNSKYGNDGKLFKNFDYVNPNAPKGGAIKMSANGTFDSLNPYVNKGTPAVGIGLIYDTLMSKSLDEPFSLYPLVAESAVRAPDNSSITFNINSKARFQDGQSITAEDVKYTFELLTEQGHPFYRSYYADVAEVKVLAPLKIQFVFRHVNNPELPFIIAELPVLPKHYWQKEENDFTAGSLKAPEGSGPYTIAEVDNGRSITFSRAKDYWGKDLPVNVGKNNFDQVQYDYYRDQNVALQAFLAGEYDLRFEYIAKNWATAYDVAPVKDGNIKLETITTRNPSPIQGFAFNLRRDKFQDRNVRKALSYAMDFEWLNRNLFFNSYNRSKSYFNNSGMEATGIPTSNELKLLEPYRDQLPSELFKQPHTLPETDGTGNIRPQLVKALTLMDSAGWRLSDGKLVNDKGAQFTIELLLAQSSMERVALPFKKNLELMGIDLSIRTVDMSQYIQRIRGFDYDMMVVSYGQSASPGNEQAGFWGSLAAGTQGSRNYMGIKSPVVDAMIEKVTVAKTRDQLTTAVQALDRVLLWGDYLIPQWYSPYDRVTFNKKLEHAQSEPLYSTDIMTWWVNPEPEVNVKQTAESQRSDMSSDDDSENKTNNAGADDNNSSRTSMIAGGILLLMTLFWFIRRRKQS